MSHATALHLTPDPDDELYRALGVDDMQIARMLHTGFSRLLGEASGQRAFTRDVVVALAGIGRLTFRRPSGEIVPALAPDIPAGGWSRGDHVMARLGLSPADLDALWLREEAHNGVHAQLDLHIVQSFFPAPVWPIAASLVRFGPGEASQRLERFARLEALRSRLRMTVAAS